MRRTFANNQRPIITHFGCSPLVSWISHQRTSHRNEQRGILFSSSSISSVRCLINGCRATTGFAPCSLRSADATESTPQKAVARPAIIVTPDDKRGIDIRRKMAPRRGVPGGRFPDEDAYVDFQLKTSQPLPHAILKMAHQKCRQCREKSFNPSG